MKTRFGIWILLGGVLLALIAGIINAIGFVGFTHEAVTHLTGTTSGVGVALAKGDYALALHMTLIMASFTGGAIISGYIIRQSQLKLGRRYGVVLLIESFALLGAANLLGAQHHVGTYLASLACGLQNAMASSYSGAVLRTTHVTGMFTDMGIMLGHALRGLSVEWWKFRLFVIIALSFLTGSAVGTAMYHHLGYDALYVAAFSTGVAAVAYVIYAHRQRQLSPA